MTAVIILFICGSIAWRLIKRQEEKAVRVKVRVNEQRKYDHNVRGRPPF